jgi:hypothetical protein
VAQHKDETIVPLSNKTTKNKVSTLSGDLTKNKNIIHIFFNYRPYISLQDFSAFDSHFGFYTLEKGKIAGGGGESGRG